MAGYIFQDVFHLGEAAVRLAMRQPGGQRMRRGQPEPVLISRYYRYNARGILLMRFRKLHCDAVLKSIHSGHTSFARQDRRHDFLEQVAGRLR